MGLGMVMYEAHETLPELFIQTLKKLNYRRPSFSHCPAPIKEY